MSDSLPPNNHGRAVPAPGLGTATHPNGAQRIAKILLVDDKAEMRELLTQLFQRWCYSTVAAGSVGEARHAILTQGPFDVVVCDFDLPDGTGLQFWSWLKWDQRDDAGFLLMSGSTSFVRHHTTDFAFLSKPFRPEELQRSVAELVGTNPQRA